MILITVCSHVQTQLRELHKEQHQDVAEHLQELKQLLISNRDPNTEVIGFRVERDIEVPQTLQTKFAAEMRDLKSKQNGENDHNVGNTLSVEEGLEAFFKHFNAVWYYLQLTIYFWLQLDLCYNRLDVIPSAHEKHLGHGPYSLEWWLDQDTTYKSRQLVR